ncbi:NLR family CARD domain-containing protein 3-like isoform X1 [Pygocentrus nattereri]|uniref:NLR family CARD domain-containing protein 3-like isoform X1 n=2 Tax=Pygocentrus nattereri TaxID=42514 RepID=UPI001890C4F5|nr:NLR family CARD domain-containing protein 3-like isoform X1 [Pygocentrus nattereri]XP_037397850.1 NLR family CARD domain-containing protein 3-like isoform X1 [Pygocentrus nattereri]
METPYQDLNTESPSLSQSLVLLNISDSPDPSCDSMRSDVSVNQPATFKDGDPSSGHSSDQVNRSDSPVSSCVSMRSDVTFIDGDPSPEYSSLQVNRSDPPELSFVSMRAASMNHPATMNNRYVSPGLRVRPDSPEPSGLSIKSDVSINQSATFKDEDLSSGHSSLQVNRSDLPERNFVSMRAASMNHPATMNNRYVSPGLRHGHASMHVQESFKLNLKMKFQCLNELITNQGNPTLLSEIYTELYITEGDSGEVDNDHEVRQIEAASRRTPTQDTPVKCNDIFKPLSEQEKPIKTVLTKGVAGIGKTVSVQKFILDWAEDKANQDVQFIFPLSFRELNFVKDKKLTLVDLLHRWFKDISKMDISKSLKALFIFDGLDECRLDLDFQSTVNLCDETESASVDMLITNLIKGNLLPSALIWITSRPAAANQIPSEIVDRVTEVRGFTEPQKEEYFRKRINDQSLANRIISHLKKSRSLLIMCHIPVFCWISATVLERMLGEAESGETPKTLTQMYTHFLIIQTKIIREKYPKNQKTNEEILLKLGQLAFQQLMKENLIFYEEDLRECGIDVEEASVYSGVCTQIFREESGLLQSKVYCFVHLSIQEHLAALYVHLTFMNQKKNVLQQSHSSKLMTLLRKEITFSDVHKSAVDQALQSKNGHLDLFLRFLLGLSLESNQNLLQDLMTETGNNSHIKEQTAQYIKMKIRENSSAEKSINLFHCLNELGDSALVEEVQQYLQTGKTKIKKLSSSQWSAVVFILLSSEEDLDGFVLWKYGRSDHVLLKLLPVVAESRTAKILCVVFFSLLRCRLTKKSCAGLASLLTSESSHLRNLYLSQNKLRDSGVKLLCAGLNNPLCKLESLRLRGCKVTVKGCAALASALKSNPSQLKELHLSKNKVGDSGVKLMCAVLENPLCKLEALWLWDCKVTDEGCAVLALALRSNPSHLRELNLRENPEIKSGREQLLALKHDEHYRLDEVIM